MIDKTISIVGFGMPVFDIIAYENVSSLIVAFRLKRDTQNELTFDILDNLLEQTKKHPYKTLPGGCAQNTVRVFRWLQNCPQPQTIIYGVIGDDEQGRYLTEQLHREGVLTRFHVASDKRTIYAILLSEKEYRTIAYTSSTKNACSGITDADIQYRNRGSQDVIASKIFLLDGYFTLNNIPYTHHLLEQCRANDTLIAFSGGGEALIKSDTFDQAYLPFLRQSNIVAMNLREFRYVCQRVDINSDIPSSMQALYDMQDNVHKTSLCPYTRVIVVTNGGESTYCYNDVDGFGEYPLPAVPAKEVIDTTGAGDSFLAGFLYGIHHQYNIERCVQIGHYAATQIIRQIGCQIPDTPPPDQFDL